VGNTFNERVICEWIPARTHTSIDGTSYWSINTNFSDKINVHFFLVLLPATSRFSGHADRMGKTRKIHTHIVKKTFWREAIIKD
jgi:hypothetical protein